MKACARDRPLPRCAHAFALNTMTTPSLHSTSRRPALHPIALAAMLALSAGSSQAQTAAPAAPDAAAHAPSLPSVTVSTSGLQLGVN